MCSPFQDLAESPSLCTKEEGGLARIGHFFNLWGDPRYNLALLNGTWNVNLLTLLR